VLAFSLTKDSPFPAVGIIFPLFGVCFVGLGIFQAVYHFKNATGRNRMSLLDIVDMEQEPDPLDKFARKRAPQAPDDERADDQDEPADNQTETADDVISCDSNPHKSVMKEHARQYCPFCGKKVEPEYRFCPHCGKAR
jgi:hypothetical protein